MTRDDIIRMALEAQAYRSSFDRWTMYDSDIERFAALVAEHEHEREALRKQEPVAWMYTDSFGTHFTDDKREWYDAAGIEEVTPLYAAPITTEFVGLNLSEMDEIINGNIKITDSRLRDGVYGVVLDTMTTLMEKNNINPGAAPEDKP